MIKYIAYCRKSTDEPDRQILSIEAQVAELEEFAAKENLKIVSFITESKTAKEPGREKFAQVLELIERGEAAGIISWHPFMSTSLFISDVRQRPLSILNRLYTGFILVFECLKHPIGQLAFKAPQSPQFSLAFG